VCLCFKIGHDGFLVYQFHSHSYSRCFRDIGVSDFIHRSGIKIQNKETRRFGNWICFRPQVREKPILLGPLERASLNHWTSFRNVVFSLVCF
jgi:hypothetical protein